MLFVILLLLSPQDRHVFRPTARPDSDWAAASSWKRINRTPTAIDRVRVSGDQGETRSVVIEENAHAEAASLFVGETADGYGVLTVHGSLTVGSSDETEDAQAGRITVGRNHGRGHLIQNGGEVSADSVWLGLNKSSRGEWLLNGGTLHIAKSLHLAPTKNTSGLLELKADAGVEVKRLLVGKGNARIRLEASGTSTPTIHVSGRSQLGGSLRVSLPSQSLPDEVVLIRNDGITLGGFRRLRISTATNSHYELTYFGGDGNEVALQKTTPVKTFEEWQTKHGLSSNPTDDLDEDRVTNVGEYKLGCCARTDEGPAFRKGTTPDGQPFIQFIERTDRSDVQAVPQWSHDGRVWNSEGLDIRSTSRRDNTQVVRVTATEPGVRFRLLFEMLPAAETRPNVLFVTIDDLNDWIEPLGGHPQSITPNLNRIASRGVLFTQAHAPAVLCNPSRVAILTGRQPSNTGVYDNEPNLRDSPVLENAVTIPENFKASGYNISGAGKVFHRNPQIAQWDDYFPSLTKNRPSSPEPDDIPLNGIKDSHGRFDWGPVDATNEDMGDYQVASWIRNRLTTSKSNEPFFLACGIYRPHLPFYVPHEHFNHWEVTDIALPTMLESDTHDLPPAALERLQFYTDHQSVVANGEWQKAIQAYLASIYFADQQLGRILDALEASPHYRNTIVVIMSDHGWQFGEKTAWRKNTLWDRSTRVPLIIAAPGVTTPGSRCDEAVSLLDVYPTLNELCSLPAVTPLDGQSLLPLLRDPKSARSEPAITTQLFKSHSVRAKRWRYIRYYNGDEELYDYGEDPHEWHNLAEDDQYESVLTELREWVPETDHPIVTRNKP
ncbi:MAG: sulfatase [Planctomycetaceae bacterium]